MSPFWRPPPQRENPPPTKRSVTQPAGSGRDPNIVVGAAYSHADILKFDSLCVDWCPVLSPWPPLLMPLQKPEPNIISSHYAAVCLPECHSQVTPERRLSSPVPNLGQ